MRLEAFFEKFDQLADMLSAVAKIRESDPDLLLYSYLSASTGLPRAA